MKLMGAEDRLIQSTEQKISDSLSEDIKLTTIFSAFRTKLKTHFKLVSS